MTSRKQHSIGPLFKCLRCGAMIEPTCCVVCDEILYWYCEGCLVTYRRDIKSHQCDPIVVARVEAARKIMERKLEEYGVCEGDKKTFGDQLQDGFKQIC